MQDFETGEANSEAAFESSAEARSRWREKARDFSSGMLRKILMFISFGPGVLGVLWLIGRIFKPR